MKIHEKRNYRLYHWLTWQSDLEKAVRSLSTRRLRELNGYLARHGAQRGIPSLIHALIRHEAADRLMLSKDTRK